MKKRLTRIGDDLALVIDRSILDKLGIDETSVLSLSTGGESLVVTPVTSLDEEAEFENALAHVNKRYAKTLKRLADR